MPDGYLPCFGCDSVQRRNAWSGVSYRQPQRVVPIEHVKRGQSTFAEGIRTLKSCKPLRTRLADFGHPLESGSHCWSSLCQLPAQPAYRVAGSAVIIRRAAQRVSFAVT